MPVFKCDMIFNAGAQGFVESWYHSTVSHSAAIDTTKQLSNARSGMLAAGVIIEAIRVSDIAVRGDSQIETQATSNISGQSTFNPGDPIFTGWYARFNAGTQARRQFFMRGMPDDWWKINAGDSHRTALVPQPAVDAFREFRAKLLELDFQMLVLEPVTSNPEFFVAGVAPDPTDPTLTLITHSAGFTPTNNKCIIYRGASIPGLRGHQKVQSIVDPTLFKIYFQYPSGSLYSGDAAVRRADRTPQSVTDGNILRIGKRDTGRALFPTRGRQ